MFCLLQEKIHVEFECPETSPAEVVSAIDQPPPQVRSNVTEKDVNVSMRITAMTSYQEFDVSNFTQES